MRILSLITCCTVILSGCASADPSAPADTGGATADSDSGTGVEIPPCERLFGAPSEQTGIDAPLCRPYCECDGETFSPPEYTSGEIDDIAARELLNPPEPLAENPYETPADYPERPDALCAVIPDDIDTNAYRLETFDDIAAAETAGGTVTHHGACGLCSSLANLAVYLRHGDLTAPVRDCGVEGALYGEENNMACLLALGFEPECARIWYFNTVNTREHCLDLCTAALGLDYHEPDGALNDCLACDEANSGAVFKAVAGRTRRNSGLPSAICRPCDTVARIIHNYP